jgi:apolipoprotein N-acyltransferase
VKLFPWLADLSPAAEGFGQGQGPEVYHFLGTKLGTQICYEGLLREFSRGLSEKGANWFLNLTNDSWFGTTSEMKQHLYMTLGRAVEFRRPLVRTTNTGISASILASGEILILSPSAQSWAGMDEVRFLKNPPQSFYSLYGKYLPWVIFISLCLVILLNLKSND